MLIVFLLKIPSMCAYRSVKIFSTVSAKIWFYRSILYFFPNKEKTTLVWLTSIKLYKSAKITNILCIEMFFANIIKNQCIRRLQLSRCNLVHSSRSHGRTRILVKLIYVDRRELTGAAQTVSIFREWKKPQKNLTSSRSKKINNGAAGLNFTRARRAPRGYIQPVPGELI